MLTLKPSVEDDVGVGDVLPPLLYPAGGVGVGSGTGVGTAMTR